MKQKKILLIIPEMSMGGAQRSLAKLSIELARDHKVWLVVFNLEDRIAYPYGGELINLDVASRDNVFHKLRSFVKRIVKLRRLKKELSIDVSISFLEGADYVNILSKSTDKIVLSIRGSKRHDEKMKTSFYLLRTKFLIPTLYRRSDIIVTVNHGIANELRTYYGLKNTEIVTIGNFYDVEEITRLSLEPKHENLNRLYKDPVLIITGRFAPEKGLKSLIKVFHGLKQVVGNLRFMMVGEGPSHQELIDVCKELGLIVHQGQDFTEPIPDIVMLESQPNVFKYLTGATLFLMNSSSEGFPNGLAEAMICRVPVVSSDCPYGPREILAPDYTFVTPVSKPFISSNGILMPIINSGDDIQIWIETLFDVLKKNELLAQLASNARERINSYDRELLTMEWNKVLADETH